MPPVPAWVAVVAPLGCVVVSLSCYEFIIYRRYAAGQSKQFKSALLKNISALTDSIQVLMIQKFKVLTFRDFSGVVNAVGNAAATLWLLLLLLLLLLPAHLHT